MGEQGECKDSVMTVSVLSRPELLLIQALTQVSTAQLVYLKSGMQE